MSLGDVTTLLREGVYQVIIMALPFLVTALVVGLVIAIFQAATSLQEQTLVFVPKVIAILLILAFLGGWMFSSLGNYTVNLFRMIPEMAK